MGTEGKVPFKKLEDTTSKVAEVEGLRYQLIWPLTNHRGNGGGRKAGNLPEPPSKSVTEPGLRGQWRFAHRLTVGGPRQPRGHNQVLSQPPFLVMLELAIHALGLLGQRRVPF